jgi:hypothetical protein
VFLPLKLFDVEPTCCVREHRVVSVLDISEVETLAFDYFCAMLVIIGPFDVCWLTDGLFFDVLDAHHRASIAREQLKHYVY